jgi:uncharacterized protein (UPF0335 family)
MRTIAVLLTVSAGLWPAAAAASQLPTLTVRQARAFVEEVNERAEERTNIEAELKGCYRVRRLQVNCREVDRVARTESHVTAGERLYELLDRVTVTPRNRLRNSPIVLRWFY